MASGKHAAGRARPAAGSVAARFGWGAAWFAAVLIGTTTLAHGSLSLEERLAARRAVEEVLHRHRIWPADNREPRPSFDEAMPPDRLRRRVEEALAASEALEVWWTRGITAADLQAEMDRMAASTKDPQRLREIFAALGDDPERIAEALARPALAERLLRRRYASDPRFHGAVREEALRALGRDRAAAALRSAGAELTETEYTAGEDPDEPPPGAPHGVVRLGPRAAWDRCVGRLAAAFGPAVADRGRGRRPADRPGAAALFDSLPVGAAGRLQESDDAFHVTAILHKEPGRIRVATARWPKRPFDDWWASVRDGLAERALSKEPEASPVSLTLPAITGAACTDDTWAPVRTAWVPDERDSFAAVWTGSEMIVWGGAGIVPGGLDTGGRYNPATDTWTPTSSGAGAPSRRWGHTAVWTGSEMIVWGGAAGQGQLNTGGRYAPATDSWIPTSTGAGAASARDAHTAVWTGTEMIVWGGNDLIGYLGTGARYDPSSDTWTPVSSTGSAPAARWLHTAAWTGSEMIVWGGWNELSLYMNTGGRYDPISDTWSATSVGTNVPQAAGGHTAVWTGAEMIVWGGLGAAGHVATGGRYDPSSDVWAPVSIGPNLPAARERHTAVWTGAEMIVWGGITPAAYATSGGRYDPAADSWSPTSTQANVPAARAWHAAVWTGSEMIVWGGYFYDGADHVLDTGGRYDPGADAWIPVVGWNDPRRSHTAVWTGSEMVVWGGERVRPPAATVVLATGGRYTPATDTWAPTATGAGAPAARIGHTAVWTGSEVIQWGGASPVHVNSGGRYDPALDTWQPTSTGANVPSVRAWHTAVWTGSEMIVWGGTNGVATQAGGSRYVPAADAWTPMAAGAQGRLAHTAVWSGSEMIVWGGTSRPIGSPPVRLDTGGRYSPTANAWIPTSSSAGVPAARESHTAVWTGSEMIVWGGSTGSAWLDSGGRYTPATDAWSTTGLAEVPSARAWHRAVWSGAEMIVWGGSFHDGSQQFLASGGRYDPAVDSWSGTSTDSGLPAARDTHTAVWTSAGMIVWGGRDAAGSLADGARYCAASCAAPVPAGSPDLGAEMAQGALVLSWTTLPDAAAWDVVRGGLGSLRVSGGDFALSTLGCLAEDAAAGTASDGDTPAAGDGFWYLVRGVSCAGAGTWDTGAPSQQGSRDPGIAASANACR